ncbi:L-glutamine synthetase [Archaeoglobus sulfaticallidus PM70-1]|uniref:Glutamate--ammonia ligase n=1 Tax=Archaeoglobus sulfaticallidus PM70-1 TaxID=387631 RepID=N0BJ90_9EURY|nr:type I glutamate--ammonia ligase [Archaeoglobus sulfaticallidus]AGK60235.1 L-glutamine synthetase [Archaeoglobus sulfaticallidus PM70-1]
MDAETVKKVLEENNVRWVLCAFSDIRGFLQTFSIPAKVFMENSVFERGIGFDGSSIRGFRSIEKSDLVWMPDPATLKVIPWIDDPIQKTAIMFGDVHEPGPAEVADCDPRAYVAKSLEKKLGDDGMSVIFGPEIEFFVFEGIDPTRLAWDMWVSPNGGAGDSWGPPRVMPESSEIEPGGFFIRPKEGYFRPPPEDTTMEYRNELSYYLEKLGVFVEYHHHEVATAGQVELDFRPKTLVDVSDAFYLYKFAAKNIAAMNGLLATFMPKPLYLDNASGMHINQSLWEGKPFEGNPVFGDADDEFMLSQKARYYIGGLLEHAKALTAICAPTINSYKRLVPGFEAPIYICWSPRNRSALVRVPMYVKSPSAVRLEYRGADPSCNPYLAFAAQVAAGLDGIKKKIEPGDPVMEDVYELSPMKRKELGIGELPTTLRDALDHLASDEVLIKTLGSHIFDAFMSLKYDEWNQYCLYITPWEILKYIDI